MKKILIFSLFFSILTNVFSEEIATSEINPTQNEDDKKNEWIIYDDDITLNLLNEPSNIFYYSSEDIKKSGKRNLLDFLKTVPGVQIAEGYFGKGSSFVKMRGASGDNPFGQVAVFIDDRRLNNPDMSPQNWDSIPLEMIDSIQVIDGGNASLYGSGAVGGVIKITTKEYAENSTFFAQFSYANNNTIAANIGTGFGDEDYGFLVTGDFFQSNGFREHNKTRNINATVSGFIDVGSSFTMKPIISFSNLFFELPGSLTEDEYNSNPRRANTVSLENNDKGEEISVSVSLATTVDFTEKIKITIPFAYSFRNRDFDNYGFSRYSNNQFEMHPKFIFTMDTLLGKMNGVGGLDFESTFYNGYKFAETERKTEISSYQINQLILGPYVNVSFVPIDNLNIVGSGRLTYSPIHISDKTVNDGDSYQSFVYDVAINYAPKNWFSAYAKYNTVFRLPFIDEKTSIAIGGGINKNLKPEHGNNAELGLKFFKKDFFKISANIFYSNLNDEISYSMITFQNENIGSTRRIGTNLNYEFSPLDWFELSGNLSYINAIFSSGEFQGKKLPLNADLTAYAKIAFNLPYGFVVSADYMFTGKRFFSGDNKNEKKLLEPVNLLGLKLSFVPKYSVLKDGLSVDFSVENLLDVKYPAFAIYTVYSDSFAYYPAEGRSFCIKASYKY